MRCNFCSDSDVLPCADPKCVRGVLEPRLVVPPRGDKSSLVTHYERVVQQLEDGALKFTWQPAGYYLDPARFPSGTEFEPS